MNKKVKVVAVRMSEDLYNKLQKEATYQKRSLSQVLRLLVESYFDDTTQQGFESPKRLYDHPLERHSPNRISASQ